jgi:DNA-binding MarR family transcriptional regulator
MIEKSSNVPRILDRLVAKELVMRTTSKEDKRETIISLTDTGIQTLQRANEALAAINKKTIVINNEEAAVLNQLLEKLRITD